MARETLSGWTMEGDRRIPGKAYPFPSDLGNALPIMFGKLEEMAAGIPPENKNYVKQQIQDRKILSGVVADISASIGSDMTFRIGFGENGYWMEMITSVGRSTMRRLKFTEPVETVTAEEVNTNTSALNVSEFSGGNWIACTDEDFAKDALLSLAQIMRSDSAYVELGYVTGTDGKTPSGFYLEEKKRDYNLVGILFPERTKVRAVETVSEADTDMYIAAIGKQLGAGYAITPIEGGYYHVESPEGQNAYISKPQIGKDEKAAIQTSGMTFILNPPNMVKESGSLEAIKFGQPGVWVAYLNFREASGGLASVRMRVKGWNGDRTVLTVTPAMNNGNASLIVTSDCLFNYPRQIVFISQGVQFGVISQTLVSPDVLSTGEEYEIVCQDRSNPSLVETKMDMKVGQGAITLGIGVQAVDVKRGKVGRLRMVLHLSPHQLNQQGLLRNALFATAKLKEIVREVVVE